MSFLPESALQDRRESHRCPDCSRGNSAANSRFSAAVSQSSLLTFQRWQPVPQSCESPPGRLNDLHSFGRDSEISLGAATSLRRWLADRRCNEAAILQTFQRCVDAAQGDVVTTVILNLF